MWHSSNPYFTEKLQYNYVNIFDWAKFNSVLENKKLVKTNQVKEYNIH